MTIEQGHKLIETLQDIAGSLHNIAVYQEQRIKLLAESVDLQRDGTTVQIKTNTALLKACEKTTNEG